MSFLNAFGALGRLMIAAALACLALGVALDGDGRVAFLVIALTLGVTGLTFAFIGSRLGRVSSLSRRLREAGEGGTATVTSLDKTGVQVNGTPVLVIGLDVDTPSHAPYSTTIRQRVPLFDAGSLRRGESVAVVVDRSDREHLAIDWDAEIDAPAPEVETTAPPAAASMVRDLEHLLRVGRQARAMITSMEDAGDMSELGLVEVGSPGDDDRLFIIGLEVQQAGLDPYDIRVAHRVPEHLLGRVGPRTRVKVAIDRSDDSAVAIDWASVGGR